MSVNEHIVCDQLYHQFLVLSHLFLVSRSAINSCPIVLVCIGLSSCLSGFPSLAQTDSLMASFPGQPG